MSAATEAADATPATPAASLELEYFHVGGCFHYDRMRDTYPTWVESMRKAGLGVAKMEAKVGGPNRLFVRNPATGQRCKVWEISPAGAANGWDYPWDANTIAKLTAWVTTGTLPEGCQAA
jgi:hypothetical protein